MHHDKFSRRRFLGSLMATVGTGAAPLAANLAALGTAAAAGASDYKALICLFMVGGNDHYNTLLATDPASWTEYRKLRDTADAASIALPAAGAAGGVLPIWPANAPAGRTFALHPQLTGLKALFDAGRAAAVANVGTLVVPTTLAQYRAQSVPLPPKLFSHSDQQAVWQSSQAEGARTGWGGRMSDYIASGNSNASLTCVSTASATVYLNGDNVRQYQMSPDGKLVAIDSLDGRLYAANTSLRAVVTGTQGHLMQTAYADTVSRAINLQAILASTLPAAGPSGIANPTNYVHPVYGTSAANPLAVQLQTVARMIAARNTLGMRRQVFFINLGTFDTHEGQKVRQADLFARLSHGLTYFDGLMGNLQGTNLRNQVTLFTASDFGRTLTTNGDGTDHGWGSHHFVVGGAVRGRNLFGPFPDIGLEHERDAGQGALIPTISVDQYGATLGTWFGLSDSQLLNVFPNLSNFSIRNIGFMS